MYDSTYGVDVGADHAVVAVQENSGWGTIDVELDDLPADLLGRVGDRQPSVLLHEGGFRLRPAHELYVDAVERALAVAGARLHRPVEGRIGLAVPAWWTERATWWTQEALAARGLGHLRLVNAAEAAVIGARSAGLTVPDDVLVVDLGARSCSATVVSGHGRHTAALPGATAVHLEGGEALDRVVLHSVLTSLDGLGVELDAFDAEHVAAARAYLDRCREIRHDLSVRTAVAAEPNLPGADHRLRIIREEFEELVVPWRNEVVRIAHAAANQSPRRVRGVLLVGGLSTTPLIGQTMSAALDVEVVGVPEPDLVIAYGAARAALAKEIPPSLWQRSRSRLARGWQRIATGGALQAPASTPLALPAGSPTPVAAEADMVLIEQVAPDPLFAEPIALGPAESEAVEVEVEVEEPVQVEEFAPLAAVPPLEDEAEEPEPEPELEPELEPEPDAEAEPVDEQTARDEAVVDLISAFVPSQRGPGEERPPALAGLMLVGSQWVRTSGPADEEVAEAQAPEETDEPFVPEQRRREGRRRRRAARRTEVTAGLTGIDALFDDERSGDVAGRR